MVNRPDSEQVRLGITVARSLFEKKGDLVKALQEIGVPVPISANYRNLVQRLELPDVWQRYVAKHFDECHFASFEELCERYALAFGVQMLDGTECELLVGWLTNNGYPHLLHGRRQRSLTEQMSDVANEVAVNDCLAGMLELAKAGSILPVDQRRRWVRGPLGVRLSVCSRKSSRVEDLVKLLNKVPDVSVRDYVTQLGLAKEESKWGKRRESTYKMRFVQAVLMSCQDKQILDAFNRLLELGTIPAPQIEVLMTLIVTPCGAFVREHQGEEQLAVQLVKDVAADQLKNELLNKKIEMGPLWLRTLELCMKDNPDETLKHFYNAMQLRSLAKRLGLVSVTNIEVQQLIEILMLRLGYSLPPRLCGLKYFTDELNRYSQQMHSVTLSPDGRRGIMSKAFINIEGLFKDLLKFYISFSLKVRGIVHFEESDQLKAVEEFNREELGSRFSISNMNLGQLVLNLENLDKKCLNDEAFVGVFKEYFARERILEPDVMKPLRAVQPMRKFFTHDVAGTTGTDVLEADQCQEILNQMLDFSGGLKNNKIYPHLVRLTNYVRDGYGRMYLQAVDEEGRDWIIKGEGYLPMETAYFMQTPTNPIAVNPVMIPKLG